MRRATSRYVRAGTMSVLVKDCWIDAIAQGVPVGMDPARLTESWGAGRRIGLAALPGGRVYWFACRSTPMMGDPTLARVDLGGLQTMFSAFHDPVQEGLRRTPADSLIWTDIIDLDPLACFTHGRVVLLGDAAHAVTPDLGQGAGLAIEDAAVLVALLARSPVEQALRQYNARRIGRVHRIARSSRLYARIAQWRNPHVVSLRNFMMKNIPEQVMAWQLDTLLSVRFEPVKVAA
jgi:2-polyprenyl-6-methoxyphenol hydroxylase-like FAD-dependent oxidoreductase